MLFRSVAVRSTSASATGSDIIHTWFLTVKKLNINILKISIMKPKITFLLMAYLVFGINCIFAQQRHARCAHHASFEKSWISDTLDALTYTINIQNLDFTNHELIAQTEVELESKINDLQEVKLELMDLTVDEVYLDGTQVFNFTHDGLILAIPLITPLNIGDNIVVSVSYHGEPFHETWGGFHWSGQYCFNLGVGLSYIPHNLGKTWFPCIDDFHDRAYYTIYATVPAGKDAVCGGLLEEVVNNGNGTFTYKWSLGQTIPTYLASIAVGDYARWTDTFSGINGDIPIEIWVRPSDSSHVDGSFQHLQAMLEFYEEKFGPYKFDRVGYVGTSTGFMEHATNIASPYAAFNGGLSYETYIAHELAHMWFGDNVTCASAEEMWLNEGWAVFCDGLIQEELYGRDQYLNFIASTHFNVIRTCHTPGGDGSYFPLNQIPQNVTYQMSAYDRGATVVHSLRGYLGDDVFFSAMAAYNEAYHYNYATSYDLRDFLSGETGIDMAPWFDNWVLNSGTPHYSADSFAIASLGKDFDVTVYLKQKRHGPAFTGDANKLEVTFMDNNWNQFSADVWFDGEAGSQVVQVPFEPDFIIPDFNQLQCDAITDSYRVIKETGNPGFTNTYLELDVESITDSAFIWIGHQWAPPDPLKNPVQGLTISDYRYWTLKGIIPEGFQATGAFFYSVSAYLDDGLLTDPNDSIVILFRPSPAYDWQFINFTKIGSWNIGKLYVENLQMGEYTMAICDETFVGYNEMPSDKDHDLNIYPNPSKNEFYFESKYSGIIFITGMDGAYIDSFTLKSKNSPVKWVPSNLPFGTYMVKLQSENNQSIACQKIVIMED
jgi:aminopeptidase N